jgi:hypothetical protein
MVYNPTKEKIEKTINVPLYYTGLTTVAKVKEKDSGGKDFQLSRNFEIALPVNLAPESYTWYVIE